MSRAGVVVLVVVMALGLAGCPLGPNYKRPSTPMSSTFRDQAVAEATSFADLPWWEVLRDPALSALIREALDNSFDLQDAVARVDVARENAHIGTDRLLPSIGIQGGPGYQQVYLGSFPGLKAGNVRYASYQAEATVSWEVDVWGRLRRLRQSAIADFFASEDNRRAVVVSLIGDIAENYFNLLALDRQLQIAHRTVDSRQETLLLFQKREAGGVGDALDTTSEQAQLADARATLTSVERQIAQTENQLALLIGRPPGPIARDATLLERAVPADQPTGLPLALLERRPDVHRAESQLVSANAQVGAAFAALFPSITFNGSAGLESGSLSNLFTSTAFTFGLNLLVNWMAPILNGAQYAHQYRGQQANYRALLADYRRAVLNALVDVANALVTIKTYRQQRVQQELGVVALTERLRLAKVRFANGVASYLDVVNAEQVLFPAELALAQTIGSQFVAYTQLYRSLGGGWQTAPSAASSPRRDR
ncbi:MAG TPA: efflux transporter outer membrane subunit [Polyangia bacterium]|nr:efflux transporter outer membrane subunit [Polyangia bacterium]